ncbi:MAG: cysteine desulfurase NifS [Candidatus Geothermincolales bacterium]
MRRVYLDNAATTQVRQEALEEMVAVYRDLFGNSASVHSFGQEARRRLEKARAEVAEVLGADPEEIVFTSGGTESDNLAIQGVARALRERGRHIITSAVEHHAVLHCCQALEREGYEVTYLPVDRHGRVDPEEVERSIRRDTVLLSVMLANNETGVMQPVEEIARIGRERGIPVHTDAVQALGKVPVDVNRLGVDLLSVSGHKFHGPKGVGALYVRRGTALEPILHGGGHERGLRPGTVNVPAIAAMARALSLAVSEMEEAAERMRSLREKLIRGIAERIDGIKVNGPLPEEPVPSLPNIVNVSFLGAEGEALLMALDMEGIAVSTGSACSSGDIEPSHVLMAMGIPPEVARCGIRFSLSRYTTEEEIELVIEVLPRLVERIRSISPRWIRNGVGSG